MSLLSRLTALELIPIITILIIVMRCIKLVLVVNVYIIHVDAYTGHRQSYVYVGIHIVIGSVLYLAHFHLLIGCIKVSLGRRFCHTSHVLGSECIFMTRPCMHDEDNYSIAMYKSIIRTHPILCQYIV